MVQLLGFGNGSSGNGVISADQDLNSTRQSCSTSSSTSLIVTDSSAFTVGNLIMIHKSRGNTTTTCGTWELNRVSAIPDSTHLTLAIPLANDYQNSGADQSQVILIPEYSSLTINNGVTVSPSPWSGSIGGILVVACNGAFANAGTISATGAGFRGGAHGDNGSSPARTAYQGEGSAGIGSAIYTANNSGGGGGAAADQAGSSGGGGGGSNAGAGSDSSSKTNGTAGLGATTIVGSADLTTMDFGGGGGGYGISGDINNLADGRAGGGIILLMTKILSNTGTISADGNSASGSSACGTGAGGSILIKAQGGGALGTITAISGTPDSNGFYSGGQGGTGRIRIEVCSRTGTTNPAASESIGGHNYCGSIVSII